MSRIQLVLCGVAALFSISTTAETRAEVYGERFGTKYTYGRSFVVPLSAPFSDKEIVTPPVDNLLPEEVTLDALTILRFLLSLLSLPSPSHRPGQ